MNPENNDEIEEKVKDMQKRIDAARPEEPINIIIEKNDGEPENKTPPAGADFLANVIAGWLIGFGIDWMLGTKPWGMIFFILMGFVSGVFRANAAMKKNNEENEK